MAAPARRGAFEPAAMSNDLIAEIQARTFEGMRAATDPQSGLTADRWPTPSACSIAAVGFALTLWPIGVERGWMTRGEAAALTRRTLTTLAEAPQGSQGGGVSGWNGFFYHFIDMRTALRAGGCELSTIDTALLLAGALAAGRYFDGDAADEAAVRDLAGGLFRRVDWRWAQAASGRFWLGWTPEGGFIPHEWRGYNEAMILYILALGAGDRAVEPGAWTAWCADYGRSWRRDPEPHLGFGPMFGHQYSHLWIDFRGIRDDFMRRRGLDYFENSRRAVAAQQAYAAANAGQWRGYAEGLWGLTACDGPGIFNHIVDGRLRSFRAYSARGADDFDDGTLAPTAVAASLPFAPEAVTATLERMTAVHGAAIYGPQGFQDAFNPTVGEPIRSAFGDIRGAAGWVGRDMLGIDQGPIVAMIENHRSGLVWRLMRDEPVIRHGLVRAGFAGGWLAGA